MVKLFLIKRLIDPAQTLAAQGKENIFNICQVPTTNHQKNPFTQKQTDKNEAIYSFTYPSNDIPY